MSRAPDDEDPCDCADLIDLRDVWLRTGGPSADDGAMRTRQKTRGLLIRTLVLLACVTLVFADVAGAQGELDEDLTYPELVAAGHGRGAGRCFVEVHTDAPWPPPKDIRRWVLVVTARVSSGTVTIRSYASHDIGAEGTTGTTVDGRRLGVEVLPVRDGVTAYRWPCGSAPSTVDIRLEYNDLEGRTLLADVIDRHGFVDEVRAAGDVPEDELVGDESGDLLPPQEGGGGAPPAPPRLGSSTSVTGGLMLMALVFTMAFLGYIVWQDRSDPSVD